MPQPEQILSMKGIHAGERAFIVGCGPSLLKQIDILPMLKDELTFVCNGWPHWEDAPFEGTYYCLTDVKEGHGPMLQWPDHNFKRILIDFPQRNNREDMPEFIYVEKAIDSKQMAEYGFVGLTDTLPALPTGWTTPLTAMQVAAWMGVREFYLIGCDFTDSGYAWDPDASKEWHLPNGHHYREFTYRSAMGVWQSAERARADIEQAGGSFIDCTPQGYLNPTAKGPFPSQSHKGLGYKPLEEVLDVVLAE